MLIASFWQTACCLYFCVGGLRLLREERFISSESETGNFFFFPVWASTLNKSLRGYVYKYIVKARMDGGDSSVFIQTVFWSVPTVLCLYSTLMFFLFAICLRGNMWCCFVHLWVGCWFCWWQQCSCSHASWCKVRSEIPHRPAKGQMCKFSVPRYYRRVHHKLSMLDYCNALKPVIWNLNLAAKAVFNNWKVFLCSSFEVAANSYSHQIQVMFAYRATTGSTYLYINSLIQIYLTSKSLHSASELCILVSLLRERKKKTHTQSLNVVLNIFFHLTAFPFYFLL